MAAFDTKQLFFPSATVDNLATPQLSVFDP